MKQDFVDIPQRLVIPDADMLSHAQRIYADMSKRRTIRNFSDRQVSQDLIETCIRIAGTAPSGANQQPWHFSIIQSPEIKKQVREAAEEEEKAFYAGRAGEVWLDTLAPLGTNADKPFLERAPILIAIFEKKFTLDKQGKKTKHYYSKESTGIATGLLITALHQVGLATLTHTPSPMNFLSKILRRPEGERAFLLLVVGHPEKGTKVPNLQKKALKDISSIH